MIDKKDEKDYLKIGGKFPDKDSILQMEKEILEDSRKADRKLPKKFCGSR